MSKKIFSNSLWMMSEKLVSIFGLIFVTSFVAKYIGPENFGKLTFASSIFAIIQTIAMFGSENIIFQKTAKNRRLGEYIIDSTKIIRDFMYVSLSLLTLVYIYFFALLKSQIIKPTTKATKKKAQYMPALKMVSTAWQLVSVSNINAKKEKYVYFFITIVFL